MASFLIYILRWAVVLTMLYSLYGLLMKRETLHSVNRLVLLVILVASMVLPLIQVDTRKPNLIVQGREMVEYQIEHLQTPYWGTPMVIVNQADSNANYEAAPVREDLNIVILSLILVYLAGVAIAWGRYLWSLASLVLLIRRGRHVEMEGLPKHVCIVTHPAIKTPSSWMRWILLTPADTQIRPILKHELAHIRLGHSWDMLLCELTCRMLWFVPFAWMLRQDLRDVHEYQADRSVLQSGINEEEYQLLLIRKATSTGLQPVVNAFNQSPIKRRFKMMYRKPSQRWVALKAAYLLPLSALALVAFARPQAMKEIEERMEEASPAITQAIKAVAQQLPSLQGKGPGVGSETTPSATEGFTNPDPNPTWEGHDTAELPDSNLVKADLADQTEEELRAKGMAVYHEVNELMDSTMQAIGARRIAEGTYVGHFQPSLNSDTVRIRHVKVLDRQSHITIASGISTISADDPYAYELTLQAETRKDRTGYYIRYLQPVNSMLRNYDKKQVDPYMLSTDSVLTGRSNKNMLHYYFTPIAIERSKQETRIFLYIGLNSKSDTEILKRQNINMYKDVAIVDDHTGDKYVCRSTDYSYFKRVKDEIVGKDTVAIFQTCLVFPPLGKRVKGAHFANINYEDDGHETFDVTALPRKGRIITQ